MRVLQAELTGESGAVQGQKKRVRDTEEAQVRAPYDDRTHAPLPLELMHSSSHSPPHTSDEHTGYEGSQG